MEVDRDGLEVLDEGECLRLLAGARVGRVGATARALPMVLPVSFRFDADRRCVYLRADAGSVLRAALDGSVVAFEVDAWDPPGPGGWSVLVVGAARPVADPVEVATVARGSPACAALGALIAIPADLVSGRRILG